MPNQAGALALVAIFGLLSLCSGPPLDEPSAAAPSTDESAPCFYVREVERFRCTTAKRSRFTESCDSHSPAENRCWIAPGALCRFSGALSSLREGD